MYVQAPPGGSPPPDGPDSATDVDEAPPARVMISEATPESWMHMRGAIHWLLRSQLRVSHITADHATGLELMTAPLIAERIRNILRTHQLPVIVGIELTKYH